MLLLAACGTGPNDPSVPAEAVPGKKVTVVEYQGRNLFCLEQSAAHGSLTYICDFAAFYNDEPVHGSKLPVAHVVLVNLPYRTRTLYCFEFDAGHGTHSATCDFERFYRENPGALPLPS